MNISIYLNALLIKIRMHRKSIMRGFKHVVTKESEVAVPEDTVIKRDGRNINKYIKKKKKKTLTDVENSPSPWRWTFLSKAVASSMESLE